MKEKCPNLTCPCCGYIVIIDEFDICPICSWQYDFFQNENFDDDYGPNRVSLRDAQKRFANNEPKYVDGMKGRDINDGDRKDPDWKPIEP